MLPKLTLVLGAANSGKSGWAERLISSTARSRVYIATAQAFDAEMRAKIDLHVARRGPDWRTIEAPTDIAAALSGVDAGDVVLLDCITLWLSNHLLGGSDLALAETDLLEALRQCPAPVIAVTNEVGAGIVPENALARQFRAAQGRLNQRLAERAELVVAVMAGLPLVLKGEIPKAAP